MTAKAAKCVRVAGIITIVCSIALLPLKDLQLRHLRSQPGYFDPTEGERGILANYLYVLIGIGVGCIFLWVASRLGQKK
jgi:hypothetical protein